MKIKTLFISLIVLLTQFVYSEDHDDHDHDHHNIKATHGGEIFEVGEHVAFIELVHDEAKGKMTLYLYDKNGKSFLIETPPRLNFEIKAGKSKKRKQLIMKALHIKHKKSYEFEISDAILKGDDFKLIVSLKLNKKSFRVNAEHSHHDADEHEGHDHDDHEGHKH